MVGRHPWQPGLSTTSGSGGTYTWLLATGVGLL